MQALIDWISFTVKQFEGKEATAKRVIEDVLGLNFELFQLMMGGYGYKRQYFHNNVKVYCDGREDMGVHVLISGRGVRYMEATKGFDWKEFFYMLINWFNAKVTRIDIALDETEGILDLDVMEQKMKNGEVISRWKSCRPVAQYNILTGESEGLTLYFGHKQSDIMCRFYDKKAQEKERYIGNGMELPDHWVRCELQLKDDRAQNFVTIYSDTNSQKDIGVYVCEILNNYIHVTDKDSDTNRSRWKNCEMWDRFLNTSEKLTLTTKPMEKRVEDLYAWVKQSVSPSLFVLFKAAYGDIDFFHELIKEGSHRLSKKHMLMLAEYENRPCDVPYSMDSVRHDLEERKYTAIWGIAERNQQYQKLINVLKNIQFKKSIKYIQRSIFDESQ